MPAIFIYALIGFAVLVVLILVLLIVFKGMRPTHDSSMRVSSHWDSNSDM